MRRRSSLRGRGGASSTAAVTRCSCFNRAIIDLSKCAVEEINSDRSCVRVLLFRSLSVLVYRPMARPPPRCFHPSTACAIALLFVSRCCCRHLCFVCYLLWLLLQQCGTHVKQNTEERRNSTISGQDA